MLKFEGIEVGQRVRAYDFQPMEGRDDVYVEGRISEIYNEDYMAYVIKCDFDTNKDEVCNRVGYDIIVPMEISIVEFDERITVLGAH